MAWIDEARKAAGAKPISRLELVTSGETLNYASPAYAPSTGYEEPRLLAASGMRRSIDVNQQAVQTSEARIVLDNADGNVSTDLQTNNVNEQDATVTLSFKADSGTVYDQVIYTGKSELRTIDSSAAEVSIRPVLRENLGVFQRSITPTAFPNAPAKNSGVGLNIVVGTVAATTGTNGAVWCPVVDTTNRKLCVAQHACKSVDAVYKDINGTISTLVLTTDYTVNLYDTDGDGNTITTITLDASDYNADYQYYADVKGLMTGGYVDLDGSTEHAYHADHADFDITGDLTIETVVYPAVVTGNRKIVCKASGAGQESYWIDFLNSTFRFVATGNGTTYWVVTVPAGVFSAATWTRIKVVYDASATEVSIYKDGTEIARANNVTQTGCTLTGTITGAIHSGTAQLMIGAYGSSASPSLYFSGKISSTGIWAVESDTGTSLFPNDANCKGYWPFDASLADISGKAHTLTGVNIAAADYGQDTDIDNKYALAHNPSLIIQEVIEQFGGDAATVDETSFDAFATECTSRGYDTAGEWGGVIPWNPGDVIVNALEILREMSACCDAVIYNTASDTIAIASADISETDAGTHNSVTIHDLTTENMTVIRRPFSLLNKCRAKFKLAQRVNQYEKFLIGTDEGSVNAYGTTAEEDVEFRFIRNNDTMQDVLTRLLKRRGGNAQQAVFTVCGFQHMDVDLTDVIEITHAQMPGPWDAKQFLVTATEPLPMQGRHAIEAVSLADVYGPVSISGEETIELTADIDTWVNSAVGGTAYGSDTNILHGEYVNGGDHYKRRSAFRFAIDSIPNTATVVSASLTIQVLAKYNVMASGTLVLILHKLNSTAWSEASTYNNFDGSAWTDSLISTTLSSSVSGSVGSRAFTLNADGITYLNTQVAASAKGYFTFQELNYDTIYDEYQYVEIASSEHGTVAYRPTLIVTYTT